MVLTKKEVDYALRDYPYKNYHKISGANGLGCYSRFPILSAHPVKYKIPRQLTKVGFSFRKSNAMAPKNGFQGVFLEWIDIDG